MSAYDELRDSETHFVVGPDPDNTTVCWCGEDHPLETGEVGAAKVARVNEPGYWTPVTEAHLDSLYLEAMLGDE